MRAGFDEEQRSIERCASELKAKIASQKECNANVDSFLTIMRRYTDIQELTAELVRKFVEKVYVYQTERVAGYKVQRIRIVWNCIGEFDPPAIKGREKTA